MIESAPRRRSRVETVTPADHIHKAAQQEPVQIPNTPPVKPDAEIEEQELNAWRLATQWMKNRLGEEKEVRLTEADYPFLYGILASGTATNTMERTQQYGKHMDLLSQEGFVPLIKEHPELLGILQDAVLDIATSGKFPPPELMTISLVADSKGLTPNIMITASPKATVAASPNYRNSAKSIPEVVGANGETRVRAIISWGNWRYLTLISFHPKRAKVE